MYMGQHKQSKHWVSSSALHLFLNCDCVFSHGNVLVMHEESLVVEEIVELLQYVTCTCTCISLKRQKNVVFKYN